jgi:PAS domain S-box-containing protein
MVDEGLQPAAAGGNDGPAPTPGSAEAPHAGNGASQDSTSAWTFEQRHRMLFEQNVAGVYCTTLAGKILDCNDSMAQMLGYESRRELMSSPATALYFGKPDRDAFLARLKKTGVLTNSELRLRRKDGTAIHILENVCLMEDEAHEPTIIQGTMVDITERKLAEEALQENERKYRKLAGELRRLSQHERTVRDGERARIARELHDELGQTLTALNMDLHWLKGRAWRDADVTLNRIASMCELMDKTLQSIHRICADLRPALLDDCGLVAAIEWQVQDFEARTGIRCRVSVGPDFPGLKTEQNLAVFRILQEAMTNIARHAHATEVSITLDSKRGSVVLQVTDNGVGISEEATRGPDALGLAGMRERALRWGGHVEITGRPGKGTRLLLQLPVTPDNAEGQT